MTAQAQPAGKRSLTQLWVMVAIFAAPVVAAWFFYLNPEYLPSGRTNKGELIQPPVLFNAESGLELSDGGAFGFDALDGKWTLVVIAEVPCAKECLGRVTDIRQIKAALGESGLAVERLAVLMGPGAGVEGDRIAREFEGMQVAVADDDAKNRLTKELGGADLARLYIRDPMGHLMMRYEPGAPAKDMLKDMERLLKASKNWIKGAQYGHK